MRTPLYILIFCVVAVPSKFSEGDDNSAALPDLALQPPRVFTDFGPDHVKSSRGAQGVPAIERSAQGRLWAAWYAGRSQRGVERSSSYCVLATSGDDGQSWSEKLVIQPRRFVHTYDPCLWIDPQWRLWFFWAQSAGVQDGRMGVWAMVTTDADSKTPKWSQPRRIANGVMLNKPTVLKNGDWLLPVGLWRDNTNVPNVKFDAEELAPYTIEMLTHDLGDERGSNVYRSADQGKSFERIGQVRIPGTRVDEHMIVERGDGSLWMLLRNTGGIAQSVSTDGGRTWSDGSLYLQGRTFRNKRFFIRRLKSGALLLVRNNSPDGKRSHMTAFVSDDDGATWKGGLLLDERESSYPDAGNPNWSEPRRLGDGILLNKPTVLSNGDWLLTSSVWKTDNSIKVYASTDQGENFTLRGTANIADPKKRGPDEPMIIERKDGSLWMLVRMQGLAETISTDRGKTWAPVQRSPIKHCTSRFFVRRLMSGSLLLVKHGPLDQRVRRKQLTAYVSDDDGKTWSGGLMIDEREDVTYPDGVQSKDGRIFIIYDHQRTPLGEVLMATFAEEDVRAGEPVSDKIRLRGKVARLPIEQADAQVKP